MKKLIIFVLSLVAPLGTLFSQSTGINNVSPRANAALHVKSSAASKQGVILPKLTTSDTIGIAPQSRDRGILFYDSTAARFMYYDGAKWRALSGGYIGTSIPTSTSWTLSGNAPDSTKDFLGTINKQPIHFRTGNAQRMTLSSAGNLGIGTASPLFSLEVYSKSGNYAAYIVNDNSDKGTSGIYSSGYNAGIEAYGKAYGVYTKGSVTGVYSIGSDYGLYGEGEVAGLQAQGLKYGVLGTVLKDGWGGVFSSNKTSASLASVDYAGIFSGSVGINTTAPLSPLHVTGGNKYITIASDGGGIQNENQRRVFETWWSASFGDYTALYSGYDWQLGVEPVSVVAGEKGVFFTRAATIGTPHGNTMAYIESATGNVGIGIGNAVPVSRLEVSGTVTVSGSGEVNRTSTGAANLVPIAYGVINLAGTPTSGSGNFSCLWNATLARYEITITGESYFFSTYTTLITPWSGNYIGSYGSVGGNLLVEFTNTANSKVQSGFSFVVYKP